MYACLFRLIWKKSISIDETEQHAEPSRSASEQQRLSLSHSLFHSDSRSLFLSYKIHFVSWEAKKVTNNSNNKKQSFLHRILY